MRPSSAVRTAAVVLAILAAALLLGRGGAAPGGAASAERDERTSGAPALAAAAPEAVAGAPPLAPRTAAAVRGHVRDAGGRAAAGVTVTLYRAEQGGRYFDADTRASATATEVAPPPGHVAPAPPAWVERRAVLTGEDGAFAFEGVPVQSHVEVVARRADASGSSAKRRVDADVVVDLALRERPGVSVRLRTSDGAPLRGGRHPLFVRREYEPGEVAPFGWTLARDDGREGAAALEIVRSRHGGASTATVRVTATPDADGRLTWRLPQSGAYRLAAFVPGHRAFVMDGVASADDGLRDLGEVTLDPEPFPGRARLLGADGRSLAGVSVALTTADEVQMPVLGPEPDGSRRTDADGWLSLEHVVEGEAYHLWVEAEGAGPAPPIRTTARLSAGATVRIGD